MSTVGRSEGGERFDQKHPTMEKAVSSFPSGGGSRPEAIKLASFPRSKKVSKVTSRGNTPRPPAFGTSQGKSKVRRVQQHRGMVAPSEAWLPKRDTRRCVLAMRSDRHARESLHILVQKQVDNVKRPCSAVATTAQYVQHH